MRQQRSQMNGDGQPGYNFFFQIASDGERRACCVKVDATSLQEASALFREKWPVIESMALGKPVIAFDVDLGTSKAGKLVAVYSRGGELYQYDVAGVSYEASQDVTYLRQFINLHSCRLGLPTSVRFDPHNPGNSLVVSERWIGLRQ